MRGQNSAHIAVEHLNGLVGFLNSANGNEAKSVALACLPVVNDLQINIATSIIQSQWNYTGNVLLEILALKNNPVLATLNNRQQKIETLNTCGKQTGS